jgi:hypothetical protein
MLEKYCFFGGRYYKYQRGFPTGIASGRELAEIYLHTVEFHALAAHRQELVFCRRYVDDLGTIINADDVGVAAFVADYTAALAVKGLEITSEISPRSL